MPKFALMTACGPPATNSRIRRPRAERLECRGDLGARPRQLARDPLVVDVGARLSDHEVLDPVGSRPAAGRSALEADAPRRRPIRGDLVDEGGHAIEVLGDGVAGRLERGRVVEDQPLDGDLREDADQLVVDGAGVDPARVVLGSVGVHVDDVGERDEIAVPSVLRHRAWTGEARDVRRVAAGDLGRQLRVDVAGRGVLDLDAMLVGPRLNHRQERLLLGVGVDSEDADRAPELPFAAAAPGPGAAVVVAGTGRQHEHRDDEQGYQSKSTHPVPPPDLGAWPVPRVVRFLTGSGTIGPRRPLGFGCGCGWAPSQPGSVPIRDRRRAASPSVRRTSPCLRR